MSYQDKRIVYLVQQGIVRYRNVSSSANAGRVFPEGYFDDKENQLSVDDQAQVKLLLKTVIS